LEIRGEPNEFETADAEESSKGLIDPDSKVILLEAIDGKESTMM
jgi:hypothetical protein